MSQLWLYVDGDGVEQGPLGPSALAAIAEPSTLVRAVDGPVRYQPFSRVKALRNAAAAPPAAPPPRIEPEPVDEFYYRDDDDRDRGPLPRAKLVSLVRDGMLRPPRDIKLGASGI